MFPSTIKISSLSRSLALCAVILVQRFLPTEIASPFIVALGLVLLSFSNTQRSYFKFVWPLIGVLIIGVMGAFDHQSRHILRDISFALTPISLVFIGYWIAGKGSMWPFILKVMMTLGLVLAVVHLKNFILDPLLLTTDIGHVRKTLGGGSGSLVVLMFLLGLFQKRLGITDLFPRLLPRLIVMPVLLASFVLSYSRTDLMVAIVLSLALLGWVSRVNSRFMLAVAVIIVGYVAIIVLTPEGEVGTFRSKIARSATEVAISDYRDQTDINQNWRGYETYRAVKTFSSGKILQQIFGQGFGALVDLGFYMQLGGDDAKYYRFIPVTHNGYIYILIKTGWLGLACYVVFYINVIRYAIRYSRSKNGEQKFLAHLLLGCILSLVATMYVVGGMAEMAESGLVLFLGYLVRRIEYLQADRSRIGVMRISR